MLRKILLGTFIAATLAVDQDTVGCGQLGEQCCTLEFITDYNDSIDAPEPTSSYEYYDENWCWGSNIVCFENKCVRPKDLPCGQLNEPCCKEDVTDYFEECLGYDNICVGGICKTEGQAACGGHEEPCCDTISGDYDDECFDSWLCLEGFCVGEAALPCGQDGERCCQPGDIPPTYSGDYYEDDYCFFPAECNAGECSTCNKPGDTCCVNKQEGTERCAGPHLCEDGVCVACGLIGMQCCPDGVEDYGNSAPCYDGLDCLQGSCQYCGYQNSACCGTGENASCKLNDLVCNGETEQCELCGNMDEMCCGNNRCNADYLQCVEGVCTCGGEGQSCCAGVCAEGLKCSVQGVCS